MSVVEVQLPPVCEKEFVKDFLHLACTPIKEQCCQAENRVPVTNGSLHGNHFPRGMLRGLSRHWCLCSEARLLMVSH